MRKSLSLILTVVMIAASLTGCTQAASKPQKVEIDTSKLDATADKLNQSADKLAEAIDKYDTAVESYDAAVEKYETAVDRLLKEDEDISYRTLIICLSPDGDSFSDKTQVNNALEDGGQVNIENFSIGESDSVFPGECESYGANNSNDYYYTRGAIINYISSLGWELVNIVDNSSSCTYFFKKAL